MIYSCNDFLDVVPDNVPTLDHSFLDRTSAEKFLATCYSSIPYLGTVANDPAIHGSDEVWSIEDSFYGTLAYNGMRLKKGEQNTNRPLFNFWDGNDHIRSLYVAIRDCNIFLENIHKVGGDLGETEKRRWISEVKFLKAYFHYYLLRMYGPIPLQKENLPVFSGVKEVRIYREPFDECVDYIVNLLDEAIPNLPLQIANVNLELGRITKPIALSLKAEVLVTAASPLFNGNPDYSNFTDSRGIELFSSEYSQSKWQRAALACKNAIDTCLLAGHKLYEFTDYPTMLSNDTRKLMSLRHTFTDKWNDEIIWTEAHLSFRDYMRATAPYFTRDYYQWTPSDPYMAPTLRMAELFYTNNGVPINEDNNFDFENRFNTTFAPANHKYFIQPGYITSMLNINRETRFYANLAFDGAIWFGNGRYKDVDQGLLSEQPWVFMTKKGQTQGKNSNLRYSITGYWIRKTSHFESVATSATSSGIVRSTFPIIRMADLYLLYAEALNESLETPNNDVYGAIDIVRNRAGLQGVEESWQNHSRYPSKPKSKEGMREIIQQERMIELAFEGKRFWDIRRWKTAYKWLNQPIKGLNADGATTQEFNVVKTLYVPQFTTKEYLFPINEYSLRVNRNLVQNPYW